MSCKEKVIEFLNRANGLSRVISWLEDEIKKNEILAQCYGGMNSGGKVQTSRRAEARYTELVNEAIDRTSELTDMKRKKSLILQETIRVILTLKSNEEQEVLLYKYVDGMRYYQICRKANMSKSTMYRVHDRGIENLAKNWENLGIEL